MKKSIRILISTLLLWSNSPTFTTVAISNEMTEDAAEATKSLLEACSAPRGQDDLEAVKTAIAFGADVNVEEERSGQTPFMSAVLRGKIRIVTYLLENAKELNVDLYKPEKSGYIPVDGAAFQGRADVMKLLLDNTEMSPTYRHADGMTPFHRTCWGPEPRHTEVTKLLLEEYGVDANILGGVNKDGGDPKTCLEMTRNEDTIALLNEWEEKQNKVDDFGAEL